MTEDEAKTKWCPFARVGTSSHPGYPAINRDVEGGVRTEEASRCEGSACMAWRWRRYADDERIPNGVWVDPTGAAAVGAKGNLKPIGYCGLAGAVQ